MKRIFFLLTLICASCPAVAQATQELWQVIGSSGHHEESGSSFRTGGDGTLDIALDRAWSKRLHLGEGSRLEFLGYSPLEARLKDGRLFVLLEGGNGPLKIHTRHSQIRLADGGFVIETGAAGDLVRVFSESVELAAAADGERAVFHELSEGWSRRVLADGVMGPPQRMLYEDYGDWQKWFKESTERKDRSRAHQDL